MSSVVVVGGGLAGLTAAARLVEQGSKVTLVSFGLGGLQLSTGCLDVLGYAPERVDDPFATLDEFCAQHPEHPYAALGADGVRAGVDFAGQFFGIERLVGKQGNYLLPTPVGGVRPTYLASPTMIEADAAAVRGKVVVAGPVELKDFQPRLVAANLARVAGWDAQAASFSLPARLNEVDSSALSYARALDDPEMVRRLATALVPLVRGAELVVLPAILGLKDPSVARALSDQLGTKVAEVALIPPSVPGMRLNEFATNAMRSHGVRLINGSRVVGLLNEGGRVTGVEVATTGHNSTVAADAVIYAPGGFESGALQLDSYGTVKESWLDLPVRVPEGELINGDRSQAQPLFESGLAVDSSMRVLDAQGSPVFPNLFAAGGVLAGAQRWRELSGDGIAVASAVRAADHSKEF